MPSRFQNTRELVDLVIANGGTASTSYELGGTHLIGVLYPSAFTGAKVKIQGSIDGTNFYDLHGSDSGTAKEIKATVNTITVVENNYDNPFNYVRLVSASVETGERILKIICNP